MSFEYLFLADERARAVLVEQQTNLGRADDAISVSSCDTDPLELTRCDDRQTLLHRSWHNRTRITYRRGGCFGLRRARVEYSRVHDGSVAVEGIDDTCDEEAVVF